jgi:hypothetical protein
MEVIISWILGNLMLEVCRTSISTNALSAIRQIEMPLGIPEAELYISAVKSTKGKKQIWHARPMMVFTPFFLEWRKYMKVSMGFLKWGYPGRLFFFCVHCKPSSYWCLIF